MPVTGSHFFIALYTGRTVSEAKIISASTDPELIAFAASRMLTETKADIAHDPLSQMSINNRLCVLRLIRDKHEGVSNEKI